MRKILNFPEAFYVITAYHDCRQLIVIMTAVTLQRNRDSWFECLPVNKSNEICHFAREKERKRKEKRQRATKRNDGQSMRSDRRVCRRPIRRRFHSRGSSCEQSNERTTDKRTRLTRSDSCFRFPEQERRASERPFLLSRSGAMLPLRRDEASFSFY